MAISESKMKANHKYDEKTYLRVTVRVPRKYEEQFKEKAAGSVNGYIVGLIEKDLGINPDTKSE